ncbi:26S proteasome non-ATPase regulatory subunit 9 [Diachasma alloeum]|uniref:26S proteasome non-ATPase regulatory subunit 9 n=1 Tax=Diachasma alloeum TaxID=454923 RepID=UPI0007382BAF|nr:26S proteasome non-ATPase regulatory subunit 9 [Diachasma alloeum]
MVVDMELEEAKTKVLNLMREKDKIEAQLAELKGILDKNHVGMTEALVDSEGYPRADIDVYQVRHARANIICLQNDHKALMKRIEAGLIEAHSVGRECLPESSASSSPRSAPVASVQDTSSPGEPFVRVNLVSEGSPAEQAGLCVNDLITEFGSVNSQNFRSLKDIGDLVAHSLNKPVIVKVKRRSDYTVLTLVPKPWAGKGLLGCNIILLESVER